MMMEVDSTLRARQLKRVALIGTRFTVETRMFGRLGDIEVVMPKPDEIERIHGIYMQVVSGNAAPEQIEELRETRARVRDARRRAGGAGGRHGSVAAAESPR